LVKLIELLSYTISTVGVLFIIVAVISKVYKAVDSSGSAIIYPYQSLSLSYSAIGLAFFISGIAGIWAIHFNNKRTLKTSVRPNTLERPIENEIQVTNKRKDVLSNMEISNSDGVENRTENNSFSFSLSQTNVPLKIDTNSSYEVKNKTATNSLSYILFALGALLLIVGIYLGTYSRVEMINQSLNIPYYGSINIPQATEVYPYQWIGILSAISSLAIVGIAIYQLKKASLMKN
jgi:hypothetical protein